MLFLSRLMMLRRSDVLGNPTIVIIVDREDLDSQTSELFVTAKRFLHEEDVRSIESRSELRSTLAGKASGGVYVTTIQKFSEDTGLLSERANIVCISDEAHRTQTGVGSKLKKTDKGVFTRYGFAKYLRDGFPNATYVGFTGTPIDETIAVFGPVVDRYTMKESSDDGITVRIAYEPRLARVQLSDDQVSKIQEYYDRCAEQGSTEEQIEESQRAMSAMSVILRNPERIARLADEPRWPLRGALLREAGGRPEGDGRLLRPPARLRPLQGDRRHTARLGGRPEGRGRVGAHARPAR